MTIIIDFKNSLVMLEKPSIDFECLLDVISVKSEGGAKEDDQDERSETAKYHTFSFGLFCPEKPEKVKTEKGCE